MSGGQAGEELFEIVDEHDKVIGLAPRSLCHGHPELVHRVAHVLVFNRRGALLLQKRALSKDIQPGKWDTSVGGHLMPGEDYEQAARREYREELGIADAHLEPWGPSRIRNAVESENVMTYVTCHEGPFRFDPGEIDEVRFWTAAEIDAAFGAGTLTPNFEVQWRRWLAEDPEKRRSLLERCLANACGKQEVQGNAKE